DIMDLTRLAVDAGQFINRTVQLTEESLGQTDKTALDPGLEELLALADATKVWTEQIITQTEVLLQPNPGARLEDRLYEHLEWSAPPRPRAHELLGEEMVQAGLEVGSTTPYGTALMRCGGTQKQLGETERKFVQSVNIHFLTPLRSFTEGEYRAIQNERKMLVNKRLDLDIAKSRLMKAHQADREARVIVILILPAEMELRICQSLFDRQAEITRRLLEGLSSSHISHMRSLTDFVDAQASYFAECQQHAEELQKHLARSVFDLIFKQITQMNAEEMNTAGRFLPASQKCPLCCDSSLTALDPTNNNVSTHSRTSRDYSASRLPAAATDAASVRTVGEAVPTNTRPVRETTTAEDALLGSRRQDAASTPVTLQLMSDDRRTFGGPTCIMPNESHRGENHPQL
uniref:BAR domain-containing protein n=1 Tax=Oryzias latipes TaxID=8090 RepID=A0A3P9LE09_ORYLA